MPSYDTNQCESDILPAKKEVKDNPNETIKLTVVFANHRETYEMRRGEVAQKIMELKNDKAVKYLYHWINK